ncbi:MAG: hypothetical protein EOO37_01860 [Cytophagaceae bacterium]|nr:MAG: hypothetical protein EOO37_01860 [Cytophagaceae bacterium]
MTLFELSAYFEEIAIRHTALQHKPEIERQQTYFCLNTDKNLDEFVRTRKMDTVLVLLSPDKKIYPPSAENFNWDKHVAFLALHRCPDNTSANIVKALNLTEIIADDFICQILEDRDVLISGVDIDSFVVEPIPPIGDNHYGHICMFNLTDQFNHYRNAERLPAR